MAAPPDLVERLLDTELLATLTTPALLEKALAWCLDQGQLPVSRGRKPSTLMRINFTTTQEATFWKVFARLRDGVR